MKKYYVLLCLLLLALQINAQTSESSYSPEYWKEYAYESDNVKFKFPTAPQISNDAEDFKGQKYATRKYLHNSKIWLGLWVINYPPKTKAEKMSLPNLYETALDAFKNLSPKIIKDENIIVSGFEGKYLHIETKDGVITHFKFFAVGKRIYYAYVAVNKGDEACVGYETDCGLLAKTFLDSISLISTLEIK